MTLFRVGGAGRLMVYLQFPFLPFLFLLLLLLPLCDWLESYLFYFLLIPTLSSFPLPHWDFLELRSLRTGWKVNSNRKKKLYDELYLILKSGK